MTKRNKQFATLFKKYRLRSEIETLAEFGDLLAQEGIVYENSIFTRWQKGERVPSDRKIVLKIIQIFAKRRGISRKEEINLFLESLDKSQINEKELEQITPYLHNIKSTNLPFDIDNFIGREQLLKEIIWELIRNKKVNIYGMPGVGKTAMAIHIAHLLQNTFTDGIFWFRVDIKEPNSIIDDMLLGLGFEISGQLTTDEKIIKIKEYSKEKKILLILDNVNQVEDFSSIFEKILNLPVSTLITSINKIDLENNKNFQLNPYTDQEFVAFAERILGIPFVETNKKDILTIGKLLGNLPITTSIVLKRIFIQPLEFKHIILNIRNRVDTLNSYEYDNKTLYQALDYTYNLLQKRTQKILLDCSLFDGSDFSSKTIAKLNRITIKKMNEEFNNLVSLSLIEKSVNNRFRLHPIIKEFLNSKNKIENYINLANFYNKELISHASGSAWYMNYLSKELENIYELIKYCYTHKQYRYVTKLWPLISTYLFYSGKWYLMYEIDNLIQSSYKKADDMRGLCNYLLEDLGRIYFYQRKIKELNRIFILVKNFSNKNNDAILNGLLQQKLGITHIFRGKYDMAEFFLKQSLNLIDKKFKNEVIKSYTYLGIVFSYKKEYQLSIQYLKKAEKQIKDIGDDTIYSYILTYLGQSYLHTGKNHLAKGYYLKAYKIVKRLNIRNGMAMVLQGLGAIAIDRDRNQAIKFLTNALKIYQELKMTSEVNLIQEQILSLGA